MFEFKATDETRRMARKIVTALKAAFELHRDMHTPSGADEAQVYLGLAELIEEEELHVIALHKGHRLMSLTEREHTAWMTIIQVDEKASQQALVGAVLLDWLSRPDGPRLPKDVSDALLGADVEVKRWGPTFTDQT